MTNESTEITHNYFQKLMGILLHPSIALQSIKPIFRESIFTLLILYLLLSTKGVIELITSGKQNIIFQLLLGIAIGLVAAWFGITILFHYVAKVLGGKGKIWNTLLLMGYISVPMILTSFLSLAIFLVATLFIPEIEKAKLDASYMVIGWAGMIWSWPGILCIYVLRFGEELSMKKSIMFIVIVMLITIIGWILPTIIPELFGK